jgi:FkbM family methyltransferase
MERVRSRLWKLLSPQKLAGAVFHFFGLLKEFPRDVRSLGWNAGWVLLRVDVEHWFRQIFQREHLAQVPRGLVTLRMRGYAYPLFIRRNSSDRFIVRQVFREQEYGSVPLALPIRWLVDAGANIGCASFYLLHRYVDAHVDVIEPDPENMEVCRRNLAPFVSRVRFHEKGVWPRSTFLRLIRPPVGEARESMVSVAECVGPEESDLEAISLDDLLSQGAPSRFDLVKMDIEGSERAVLEGIPGWLSSTNNLMIELHGPECRRVFERVLTRFHPERMTQVGDVTVCAGWRPGGHEEAVREDVFASSS